MSFKLSDNIKLVQPETVTIGDTELDWDDILSEAFKRDKVMIMKGPAATGSMTVELLNQILVRGKRAGNEIDTVLLSEASLKSFFEMQGKEDEEIEKLMEQDVHETFTVKMEATPESVNPNLVLGFNSEVGLDSLIVGVV